MTTTAQRPTIIAPPTEKVPRWRLVAFWVLLVVLLFLHLGERPQMLGFVVTAFGDVGDLAGHEMHMFAQGVFAWAMLAAVAVNLRRPTRKAGAAWVYGLGTVLPFSLFVVFADLPAEIVPILIAAIAVAALAFFAHPAPLGAKFTPATRPSPILGGLAAVAAIPLIVYAVGQLNIHLGSGAHDEHWEFGHWIVMAAVALLAVGLALVAAAKVAGWRVPLWTAGLMIAALGIASLGVDAVSQFATMWALLAIAWGGAFIAVGEIEARRDTGMAPARPDA
jgi:hypothetical protein